MDLQQAVEKARVFLKEQAGQKFFSLESAEPMVRLVVNTGIFHVKEIEILIDTEGQVRYFGPVRELLPALQKPQRSVNP